MFKTLEETIREKASKQGLVGSQFTVRVLEDHPDHLDVSLVAEPFNGDTVDFGIQGNDIIPYEEA
jgi:hypothetical protein